MRQSMKRIALALVFVLLAWPARAASAGGPAAAEDLPAPPRQAGPDSRWLHVALGAYTAAQGLDLGVTMYCLGQGTCDERNPLLRPLQDRPLPFAAAKMGIVAAQTGFFVWAHKRHPRLTTWVAVAGAAAYTGIAIRNARHLR